LGIPKQEGWKILIKEKRGIRKSKNISKKKNQTWGAKIDDS